MPLFLIVPQRDILGHFCAAHRGFLHPGGAAATDLLLDALEPAAGDCVLELGCGTGATLVAISSRAPAIVLHAVDASPDMVEKARARLAFCGLRRGVKLQCLRDVRQLPFADQTFDKAYAESVLAIQEGDALPVLLGELRRVLKPGGRLCLNELLWDPTVTSQELVALNRYASDHYGIIQATDLYPYVRDWERSLEVAGFGSISSANIRVLRGQRRPSRWGHVDWRSWLYSSAGRLKASLSPDLRAEWGRYRTAIAARPMADKLVPYLISARRAQGANASSAPVTRRDKAASEATSC